MNNNARRLREKPLDVFFLLWWGREEQILDCINSFGLLQFFWIASSLLSEEGRRIVGKKRKKKTVKKRVRNDHQTLANF